MNQVGTTVSNERVHPSRDRDVKLEFGRRLQAELIRRGWNQSELARQAALHTPGKDFGRDLVSGYIRGRILPSPVHMNALCKALDKKPEDLMPASALPERGMVPRRMTSVEEGRVLLEINQVVDEHVALQVLGLLTPKKQDGG